MADLPVIFEEDIEGNRTRMLKRLEGSLGRALSPADIEVLIANAFLYELHLLCVKGNEAIRQCLARFSTGPMLELLGELVNVSRIPASGAQCTIRFNLVAGHNAVMLPAAIRIQSIDGKAVFITSGSVDVPIGVDSIEVNAVCQAQGSVGNGYDPGKVSVLLDPQAFVTSAVNIDRTSGGNDSEADEQLRGRIYLAPSSFSVAGPEDGYRFWARSAHPSIVDVACITTNPGEITLYPLCTGGTLPSQHIRDLVKSICSGEKVAPQNDTVLVDVPSVLDYTINVELVLYTGAISADVLSVVNSNLTAFKNERDNLLGMDVIRSQLNALCIVKDKVYNVSLVSPSADIIADKKTFARCNGISVTVIGSNNG